MAIHTENPPCQNSINAPLKAVPSTEISVMALKNGIKDPASAEDDAIHRTILKSTRALIADLCQQFDGGHPGGAMGMTAIGICLWRYAMRYSPIHPGWFNRDRFVLSNGHTCLLQYIFMHYAGYPDMTMDQLKSYHSERTDSLCPGHPEIENPGIEVSTGPLGQGIANAVGLAMAGKHLASVYNRDGYPIIDNTVWCIVGDACLQEGVALEAISLAGQWGLDNLVVIYDNNQIQSDGPVSLTNGEIINQKVAASGWHVLEVENGSKEVGYILKAFAEATTTKGKPTFINIKTVIGIDTRIASNRKAHGTPLGDTEIRALKLRYSLDPDIKFHVPQTVYEFFAPVSRRGAKEYTEWQDMLRKYSNDYPDLYAKLHRRMVGDITIDIPCITGLQSPTNEGAKHAIHPSLKNSPSLLVGTADLDSSVKLAWDGKSDFQRPDLVIEPSLSGTYSGRYIHYGTREHAMAAISNGLAAYHPGTIIPVTSTFLIFTLYAAPAIRMAALQGLQVIHIATHDSISIGEDGPTHQPVEVAALYRAMPNILYIRPCDTEELAGAWQVALQARKTPTVLSLSRGEVEQYPGLTKRSGVLQGAYVVVEDEEAELTLLGVGSEFPIALRTQQALRSQGVKARVVSFPCQRLFEQQSRTYRRNILRRHCGIPAIVIEAYTANGWERYADAGISMRSFGKSLPPEKVMRHFGFHEETIVPKVVNFLKRWVKGQARGDWTDL